MSLFLLLFLITVVVCYLLLFFFVFEGGWLFNAHVLEHILYLKSVLWDAVSISPSDHPVWQYAHVLLNPIEPAFLHLHHLFSPQDSPSLKLLERLDRLSGSGQHAKNVESNSLAERSALADGDLVTFFDTESRGNMRGEVGVPLFVSGVLGDEVEVFSADDQGSVHFGRDDSAGEDTASDRHQTGEWAFLVNVWSFNGRLWRSEAQPDVLVPSSSTLANSPAFGGLEFVVEEDVRLLLVGALGLDCQLGRHDCVLLTEEKVERFAMEIV